MSYLTFIENYETNKMKYHYVTENRVRCSEIGLFFVITKSSHEESPIQLTLSP